MIKQRLFNGFDAISIKGEINMIRKIFGSNNRSNSEYFNNLLKSCEEDFENGKYFVPSIFYVFLSNDNKLKLKTAILLEKVLEKLNFKDICNIENNRYYYNDYDYYQNNIKYNVRDFLTDDMTSNQKFAVIVFSSFHANGYIRESAVRHLASYKGSLPYIVFRVNDWVRPIRKTAEEAFYQKISAIQDDELIKAIPYIYKLYNSTRRSKYIIDLIDERLCSEKGITALKIGLRSKDLYTRKICVSLLLKIKNINSDIFVKHLEVEKEPFLRQRLYLRLINDKYNVLEISEKFLKDKFPANRAIALRYIYEYSKKDAFDKAMNMLLDKDTRVRELSQNIIQKLNPNVDIHEIYLKSIDNKTSVAILGLSETGNISDCEIIEKYLYSDKVSVIRSAMISLLRLNSKKYQNNITEMLLSKNCGIVKTAKLLIQKYYIQNFKRIYEIYQISDIESTKINCLALLFTDTKWQRLIYMLRALNDSNIKIREMAMLSINFWIDKYNRSFVPISEKDKKILQDLICQNERQLGKSVAKTLLFLTR